MHTAVPDFVSLLVLLSCSVGFGLVYFWFQRFDCDLGVFFIVFFLEVKVLVL